MKHRLGLRFCGVVLGFGCLIGCQPRGYVPMDDAAERLPFRVEGTSDRVMSQRQARLQKQGVQFISMGQQHLISVPARLLFPEQSPQLLWPAYGLLNEIACYLQEFRKISVYVTAFSEPCVSAQREHALTLARARSVGDYLWSQDIRSRFVFTQGAGSDKPIVAYNTPRDVSANARIEITFRDAVA